MKKTVYLALFTVLALMVSYVESIVPMPVPVPGIKLGLANIVTLYLIINKENTGAFLVLLARTVLATLLFATPVNLLYSLGGGLSALAIMLLLARLYPNRISLIGVSVAGAVFHNIGQIAVACAVLKSFSLINYLPVLILVALVTGTVIALLGNWTFPKIKMFHVEQ